MGKFVTLSMCLVTAWAFCAFPSGCGSPRQKAENGGGEDGEAGAGGGGGQGGSDEGSGGAGGGDASEGAADAGVKPGGSGGAGGSQGGAGGTQGGAGGTQVGAGGSQGGIGGNAQAAPEYLWVNTVLEWRNGSGWPRAVNVPKSMPSLSDPATRYGRGKTQVRVVVEEVSGPTSLDTCFGHNKHGWDYSTCINCTGMITKAGTMECHAELAYCFAKGRDGAGCHGAPGAATLSEGPPKEKKHVIVKWDEEVFASDEFMLNHPPAATPFKAKYQIVFVPADQEFSGWGNYPLP